MNYLFHREWSRREWGEVSTCCFQSVCGTPQFRPTAEPDSPGAGGETAYRGPSHTHNTLTSSVALCVKVEGLSGSAMVSVTEDLIDSVKRGSVENGRCVCVCEVCVCV